MRCLRFVAVFTVIALMIPFTSLHYITDSDVRNNSPIISHDSVEPDYDSEIKRVDPATPVSLSEEVNPSLDPVLGTLNPTTIEQSGYSCTGNITARTDTHLNTQQELSIDTAHDWVASSADVRLWNLEQLYALNGTFEQGLPGINIQPNGTADYYPFGWTSNSTDTPTYSDDVQLSSYESGDDTFIAVENIGGKVGQNEFGHDAGIKITWAQTIQNIPYTEDFLLNFNFFYLRGPLNLNPSDPITGNCSIYVYIDGVPIWNMSLLTLSERGVWNDIGIIPIHLTGVPVSFVFEIGLEVDETLILDKRKDYDNNGLEDGTLYTQYITVYFDDLSFIAATPPSCDVVGLEFSVDGLIGEIVGTGGIGYGIIANTDYWVSSPLAFSIYSNTSVSFDYCIDLLNHRFINSSWRTDVSSIGVQYSVTSGNSADLNLYTYLGIIGVYDNIHINYIVAACTELYE